MQAPNPFAGTRFLLSAAQLTQLPADTLPEVAFVGRSNAGKSSALNLICAHKQLARVSKTPGRTQLINLFGVPLERAAAGDTPDAIAGRLVDLPGYGFADVPQAVRRNWGLLVGGYVEKRANLRGLIVLMDIRHPLTDLDWQMLRWSGARNLPCHVLLTKDDKLGHGAAQAALLGVRAQLREAGSAVTVQRFSAHTRAGADHARAVVAGWLGLAGVPASAG
ncbi:MAG: YihA family ribosome biogenesis GTP-binding protein [Nevskia sp.]|nr:YihA family ribosome biogenesis GTP-binding protein [Nevskia sp.]